MKRTTKKGFSLPPRLKKLQSMQDETINALGNANREVERLKKELADIQADIAKEISAL